MKFYSALCIILLSTPIAMTTASGTKVTSTTTTTKNKKKDDNDNIDINTTRTTTRPNGNIDHVKRYTLFGTIPRLDTCFPFNDFCNPSLLAGGSVSAAATCLAAKEAASSAVATFGVRGRLRVRENKNGNVRRIRFNSIVDSGALAVSFLKQQQDANDASLMGAMALSPSYAGITTETRSNRRLLENVLERAEAVGTDGETIVSSIGLAQANSGSGSTVDALADVKVLVRGRSISRFEGVVPTYVGSFSPMMEEDENNNEANSSSSPPSIAQAAAAAYAEAFDRAQRLYLNGGKGENDNDTDGAVDEAGVAALALAFGESYANSLGRTQLVSFTKGIVRDTDGGVRLRLDGLVDDKVGVSVQCGVW